MNIDGIIWLDHIVDKLIVKHHVECLEVEEVLTNECKFRFVQNGDRHDENVYMALGQTESGRYLTVLFILKKTGDALILSARDMAAKEKRIYGRK